MTLGGKQLVSLPIEYAETQSIFSEITEKNHRSVLITSAVQGEGVSTVAYALAQKAAATGLKTLLLEFNTHTPFLADTLGIPSLNWSLDHLPDPNFMVSYSPKGLTFLAAPSQRSFSVNTRKSEFISAALEHFSSAFDLVIGDAPCLCHPNLNGIPTKMLARHFSATILVVATNKTSAGQVKRAVDQLTNDEICIAGTVLNDQNYPSLYKEMERQFLKAGKLGNWIWKRVQPTIRQAPFMTENF
ncbi:MAG: hypothetical protein V7750_11125 [Sneathiella sp.]